MKKTFMMVLVLSAALPAMGYDAEVYEQVGIATFFTQYLYLGSYDLLDIEITEQSTSASFDLRSTYYLDYQSPGWLIEAGNGFASLLDVTSESLLLENDLSVHVSKYFDVVPWLPLRLYVDGDMSVDWNKQNGYSGVGFLEGSFGYTAGIGIGRIINVQPIARTISIARDLDIELSNEEIIEAASVVARGAEYRYRYRQDFEEVFFKAIAESLGDDHGPLAVRSAYYRATNTSPRTIGWSITADYQWTLGITDTYAGPEGTDYAYLSVIGKAGIPIGLDMQLSPSATYLQRLSDAGGANGQISTYLYLDHPNLWRSSAGVSFGAYFAPGLAPDPWYRFEIGTGANILYRLRTDISLLYFGNIDGGSLSVNMSLAYYIL